MSITEKELIEAFEAAYEDAFGHAEGMAAAARKAAELLGVELADPKPEPGTWFLDYQQAPLIVDEHGDLRRFLNTGSTQLVAKRDSQWPPTLTPARVVPAAPVELTEEQVGALFEANRAEGVIEWEGRVRLFRQAATATVNAALAKYGHGVA